MPQSLKVSKQIFPSYTSSPKTKPELPLLLYFLVHKWSSEFLIPFLQASVLWLYIFSFNWCIFFFHPPPLVNFYVFSTEGILSIWEYGLEVKKPPRKDPWLWGGSCFIWKYSLPSQGGPTKEWLLTWQAGNLPCGKQE